MNGLATLMPLSCTTLAMCTTYQATGLDSTTITAPRGGAIANGLYQLRTGNARGPLGHDLAIIVQGGQVRRRSDPGLRDLRVRIARI